MYTLFHYEHCPFCIRVRMTFGLLDKAYESKVLPYNDVKTPESLTGKKMLPILSVNSKPMNESLEIMQLLDETNKLKIKETINDPSFPQFEALLSRLSNLVHPLAMPYWIWTPEFDEDSRNYFLIQKEKKRGPFKNLVHNRDTFISALDKEWRELEKNLHPFFESDEFGLKDILLASHLWGLYVVPEFQFPEKIHGYLQSVKNICKFDYHQDFWR